MLTTLIAAVASGEATMAVQRARSAAIAYLVAAMLLLVGAGFLLAALYIWLARVYGPVIAASSVGGGFVLLAIITLVYHRVSAASRARRDADRRAANLKAMGVASALAALPNITRGKAGTGIVLGTVTALAALAIYRGISRRPERDDEE